MKLLPDLFVFRFEANAPPQWMSRVGQPNAAPAAHGRRAVLVGFEPDGADAMGGELLVALLSIAGHADRADDLARPIANLQAAALRKNLLAARRDEIAHEDRLLLGAYFHELGGAPHGERGVGLAVRHLESDHRAAVLLLECLHLAPGLDDDDRERAAIEFGAARQDRVDEAVGLGERDGGHGPSSSGIDANAFAF